MCKKLNVQQAMLLQRATDLLSSTRCYRFILEQVNALRLEYQNIINDSSIKILFFQIWITLPRPKYFLNRTKCHLLKR